MAKQVLSNDSQFVSLPELDMYNLPPTQVAIEQVQTIQLPPAIGVTEDSDTWEFVLGASPFWTSLDQIYVSFKAKIVRGDGADMKWTNPGEMPVNPGLTAGREALTKFQADRTAWVEKEKDNDTVAPLTGLATTLFKSIRISTPSQTIYDSGPNQPYLAHISTLLNANEHAQKTWLKAGLWTQDDSQFMGTYECEGFQERAKAFSSGDTVEVAGKLVNNMFAVSKLFVNYIDLRFTLQRSSNPFCLVAFNATSAARQYKLKITDMKLSITRAMLTPALEMALDEQLKSTPFRYPLRRLTCRTFVIPKGSHSAYQNIHTNVVPKRMFFAFVPEKNFTGRFDTNPLLYYAPPIATLEVIAGGRKLPPDTQEIDINKGHAKNAYLELMRVLGTDTMQTQSSITFNDWKSNMCIFGVRTDNELTSTSGNFSVIERGPTSIKVNFRDQTDDNIILIAISEFETILSVNHRREMIADYTPQ